MGKSADNAEVPDDQATDPQRKRTAKKQAPETPAPADTAVNAIDIGPDPVPATGGAGGVDRRGGGKRSDGAETAPRSRNSRTKQTAALAQTSLRAGRTGPVPDSVRERFIHIGNRFYFPDGAEAFTDHGNRVTTRSENAVVIQSMIAIARARTQGPVTVKGTDFFRKEAWFTARLAGLEVRGYGPTPVEEERLVRAIALQRAPEQGEVITSSAKPSHGKIKSSPQRSQARGTVEPRRQEDSREGELIVGRLVDHRPASYQHWPDQPMSYYVRIETARGDREIWGVDLERAFRQSLSTPGIGDEIGIRAVGRESVKVPAPNHNQPGQVVDRGTIETHRNQWIVERKDFLDQRAKMAELFRDASVSAAEAIKRHPELEGSYLQLQMGRALAEKQYPTKTHREQFVEHLRMHLARRIEIGQPLEPVPLRAREEGVTERARAPEHDHSPTR